MGALPDNREGIHSGNRSAEPRFDVYFGHRAETDESASPAENSNSSAIPIFDCSRSSLNLVKTVKICFVGEEDRDHLPVHREEVFATSNNLGWGETRD